MISASGGAGCANGGGGGSGGRVSIWLNDSIKSFNGTIEVVGGSQVKYPVYPAGGTVYIADELGNSGSLIAYDGCNNGAPISICPGNYSYPLSAIDRILVTNTNIDLQHGNALRINYIRLLHGDYLSSLFRFTCSNGSFLITNNTSVMMTSGLTISEFDIFLLSGDLNVEGNVSINQGTLAVDPLSSRISTGSVPSSYSFSFTNLLIEASGSMIFLPTTTFSAAAITISVSGLLQIDGNLSAAGVVLNRPSSTHNSTLSNGGYATSTVPAGGGGSAGYGTSGGYVANWGLPSVSSPYSSSPGGAGGGSLNISGGNGGAGLTIAAHSLSIQGTLTVSGKSGSCTGCGGGAGGALNIAVTIIDGRGSIMANGGHGAISNVSSFHGGGGSGGVVVISSCQYLFTGSIEALGGLSLQPQEEFFNAGIFDVEVKNFYLQKSKLKLVAGAAGLIISNSTCSRCAFLNLTSWTASTFNKYSSDPALQMIAFILGFPSVSWGITSIGTTYLHLQASQTLSYSFCAVTLTNPAIELTFVGPGNVTINRFFGKGSVVAFENGAYWIDSDDYITVDGFLMKTSVMTNNYSLLLTSGAQLLWTSNNTIVLHTVEVSMNSSIQGPFLALTADEVFVTRNSSIMSDNMGYLGSLPGMTAVRGSGPSGGLNAAAGANGGGHAGIGLNGISAVYLSLAEDEQAGYFGTKVPAIGNYTSLIYGNLTAPSTAGSGGGAVGGNPLGRGGNGGGVVQIKARYIYIDATSSISADGESVYGGGGGGAGGSIWLSGASLKIGGSGSIHANGGLTCLQNDCTPTSNFTGGGGSGGYIRIDNDLVNFTGSISSLSGCGVSSLGNYVTAAKGQVLFEKELFTTKLNITPGNIFCDVQLLVRPLFLVQTIYMSGSGNGSVFSSGNSAIIRGFWTISFRSRVSQLLPSSISAFLLQKALQNITGESHISVTKYVFDVNGWAWRITFHDSVDRVTVLRVDGSMLYTTNKNAEIAVNVTFPAADFIQQQDIDLAHAIYSSTEIADLVGFNYAILGSNSSGYWLNDTVFRIETGNFNQNYSLLVGKLKINFFSPIPTNSGIFSTINYVS